jgi:RNA polymerase sigma-70 factor (ECF subfamily)
VLKEIDGFQGETGGEFSAERSGGKRRRPRAPKDLSSKAVVLPRANKNPFASPRPVVSQISARAPAGPLSRRERSPDYARVSAFPEADPLAISRREEVLLMAEVAERSPAAFEKIYYRFYPSLYACVLKIVRCRAEAEDVLQEAFVAVWSRASGYRPELGQPFAWAAAIARHKAFNCLRKRSRELEKSLRAMRLREDDRDPIPAPGGLEVTERDRVLRAAFARLARPEVRAIGLSFFDGLTHSEISSLLNLPAGTVKARIRRALLKLRPMVSALADAPARSSPRRSAILPNPRPITL